jgi:hypothetical protein
MGQGCLSVIFIIFAIFIISTLFKGSSSNNSNSSTPTSSTPEPVDEGLTRVRFVRVCHEIITDSLKAPKTAQYREGLDEDDAITTVGNDLNLVTYVDSENSFGALIRTNFNCFFNRKENTVKATAI